MIIKNSDFYYPGRTILCDSRQQCHKHDVTEYNLRELGYILMPATLPVGDYALMTTRMTELFNLKKHANFSRKCKTGKLQDDIDIKALSLAGTYSTCVDTKANLDELYKNLCIRTPDDSYRFEAEAMLARNLGIKLVIITTVDQKFSWPQSISDYCSYGGWRGAGEAMLQAMTRLYTIYECGFEFIPEPYVASRISQILCTERYLH